jgi:hypothetical protein
MKNRDVRMGAGVLFIILTLALAGCRPAQPQASVEDSGAMVAATEAAERANEAREIADATLGKQSEILAQGDLAQNGREELLVVNRVSKNAAVAGDGNSSPILVMRAAILENDSGKWSEILRCDEHLKNPSGYLGGAPFARVSGWLLNYSQDPAKGFEMTFTPAEGAASNQTSNGRGVGTPVHVRWNKAANRYQSLDSSQKRFLPELPALEAEPSFLK